MHLEISDSEFVMADFIILVSNWGTPQKNSMFRLIQEVIRCGWHAIHAMDALHPVG